MPDSTGSRRGGLTAALESPEPQRRSFLDYRGFIRSHYDGLPGALTAFTGLVTGHEALAGRLIRPGAFDVRGCKRILDAGCGNGRYSRFLLRHADPDAVLTAFDLSPNMLRRARRRRGGDRVSHVQGRSVLNTEDVLRFARKILPGDGVTLTVIRGQETVEIRFPAAEGL